MSRQKLYDGKIWKYKNNQRKGHCFHPFLLLSIFHYNLHSLILICFRFFEILFLLSYIKVHIHNILILIGLNSLIFPSLL